MPGPIPGDSGPHRTRRHSVPFLGYALSNWNGWAIIVAVTLGSAALSIAQPLPMKVFVDNALKQERLPDWLANLTYWLPGIDSPHGLLAWSAAAGVAIFLLNSVADAVLTFTWIHVGQRMTYSLAGDLFSRLQRRSLVFHRRSCVGDLLDRVMTDSWCVYKIADMTLFGFLRAAIMLGGMTVVMWHSDRLLTLISLSILPMMLVASMMLGRPLRRAAHTQRELQGRIQSHVHQILLGIPVVQAFATEDEEQFRFQELADRAIDVHRRRALLGSLSGFTSGITTVAGSAVVLWVGATRVLDGRLSLGGLLIFLTYLTTLQLQFKILAGMYSTYQEQRVSLDRLREVFQAAPEVQQRQNAATLKSPTKIVEFESVSFGYETDCPVLSEINLQVRRGEVVALVGPTGAGKSTIAALVPRFFDPWRGRVLIDGRDIRDFTLQSLRGQISVVLQEPFLLPMTIADNIAFGRPDASRAQIEAAALAANAHQFIERLPGGYDFVLGERGGTLSGGERQRISIARAILKDAPILILDEPTSSLDAHTETLLLEALARLMENRAVLMIAHRFSMLRNVDRIVVLEHGRIVEQGAHHELLKAGGTYGDLYQPQALHYQRSPLSSIATGSEYA